MPVGRKTLRHLWGLFHVRRQREAVQEEVPKRDCCFTGHVVIAATMRCYSAASGFRQDELAFVLKLHPQIERVGEIAVFRKQVAVRPLGVKGYLNRLGC